MKGAAVISVDQEMNQADMETRKYLEELRDEIIEDYTAILVSLSDIDDEDEQLLQHEKFEQEEVQKQQRELYLTHIHTITTFLERSVYIHSMTSHSDEVHKDFVEKATGLILDISTQYNFNSEVKQLISKEYVQHLLTALNALGDEESMELANSCHE